MSEIDLSIGFPGGWKHTKIGFSRKLKSFASQGLVVQIVISDNSLQRSSIWQSLEDLRFSKWRDIVDNYWQPLLNPVARLQSEFPYHFRGGAPEGSYAITALRVQRTLV